MRSTVCKIACAILLPFAALADWRADMDGQCWTPPVASGMTWVSISNLVSHWKMNDNAANATVDDNYGSNDGTARNNTSAITTNGKINSAIKQITVNDYISCGYSGLPSLTASPLTISAWIKIARTDANVGFLGWGKASQYYIATLIYQRKLQISNAVDQNLFGTTLLDDDQWHHIVFVWTGSSGSAYVDGAVETLTGTLTKTTQNGVNRCDIGSFEGIAGTGWTGGIDDVRVYSRALTADEAAMLYFGGAGSEDD